MESGNTKMDKESEERFELLKANKRSAQANLTKSINELERLTMQPIANSEDVTEIHKALTTMDTRLSNFRKLSDRLSTLLIEVMDIAGNDELTKTIEEKRGEAEVVRAKADSRLSVWFKDNPRAAATKDPDVVRLKQELQGLAIKLAQQQKQVDQARQPEVTSQQLLEVLQLQRTPDPMLMQLLEQQQKQLELMQQQLQIVGRENQGRAGRDGQEATRSHLSGIGQNTVRLEPVKVPIFDGKKPSDFLAFWALFEAAVHNGTMSQVEKLLTLRASLRGEPERLISALAFVADSYPLAIKKLHDRYGDKEVIIADLLDDLYHLPVVKGEGSLEDVRKLYDHVSTRTESLGALGVPESEFAGGLGLSIIRSLPGPMKDKWAEDANNRARDFKKVMEFLKARMEALERRQLVSGIEAEKKTVPRRADPLPPLLPTTSFNAMTAVVTPLSSECPFGCGSKHRPSLCPQSVSQRRDAMRRKNRCFACLREGHPVKNCTSKVIGNCPRCAEQGVTVRHHLALCERPPPKTSNVKRGNRKSGNGFAGHPSDSQHTTYSVSNPTFLQTAMAELVGASDRTTVRILFDLGATKSFITASKARMAKLSTLGEAEQSEIAGWGGTLTKEKIWPVAARLRNLKNGENFIDLVLWAKEGLLCHPIRRVPHGPWLEEVQKRGLRLADQSLEDDYGSEQIDIVIAGDNYWRIVAKEGSLALDNGPTASDTLFGWTLSGPTTKDQKELLNVTMMLMASRDPNEHVRDLLERQWRLEDIAPSQEGPSVEHRPDGAMIRLSRSILQRPDGHYQVELPIKPNICQLPTNEQLARAILRRDAVRLEKAGLLSKFDGEIGELLNRGFIEEVVERSSPERVHYLPFRAIYKASSTTPMRLVFNAAARSRDQLSLNDCLEAGPNLLPQLLAILLRFRLHRVALAADIEKAFLQIFVHPRDRDLVRFMWIDLKDPTRTTVKIFRWKVVVFGLTCSPFLLAATLLHHLNGCKAENPALVDHLNSCFYVDDLLTGADTVEQALQVAQKTIELLQRAGFPLRKFASNSVELEQALPDPSRSAVVTIAEDPTTKVLGMVWNKHEDVFTFSIADILKQIEGGNFNSMRQMLSITARVFDPLGLVSPYTTLARMAYQTLWRLKLGWDDVLPPELAKDWAIWLAELHVLPSLQFPRCISTESTLDIAEQQLHVFCDASEKAYGAVAYMRTVNSRGIITVNLVASKTRVAPLKPAHSIPRLELLAAVLGTQLVDYIASAWKSSRQVEYFYYSDSEVALAWIGGEPFRWKTFVAHRVQLIQNASNAKQWTHVAGADNPADLCSRGASASTLLGSRLWKVGPEWLGKPQPDWPAKKIKVAFCQQAEFIKEAKKNQTVVLNMTTTAVGQPQLLITSDYSTWNRLVRVTAWILRFVHNTRHDTSKFEGPLSTEERSKAHLHWVRRTQAEAFGKEIQVLQECESSRLARSIVKSSPLATLPVYWDAHSDVIRLKRRTSNSSVSREDPVVLPVKSHYGDLMITHVHQVNLHMGVSHTLNELRKSVWVIKGRRRVREVIIRCVTCKRMQGPCIKQPVGQLPLERCSPSAPFENTGLDFTGAVTVREVCASQNMRREGQSPSTAKVYILLFTCASTRAVHLELCDSMSTTDVIMALERFVARRGMCRTFFSDNGTSFRSANRELERIRALLKTDEAQSFFGRRQLNWRFICERAPWWGGFWERLVGSVKQPLRKVFGNALFNREELTQS